MATKELLIDGRNQSNMSQELYDNIRSEIDKFEGLMLTVTAVGILNMVANDMLEEARGDTGL